jgi:hypothetical protein
MTDLSPMTNYLLPIVGAMVSLALALFGLFKHIASTAEAIKSDLGPKILAVQAELQTRIEVHEVKLAGLRLETEQRVERVAAMEAKARQDNNNSLGAQFDKLEQQVQKIAEQAVRKEDLSRVERTLDTLVMKLGSTDVLAAKVDNLSSQFVEFLKRSDHSNQGK